MLIYCDNNNCIYCTKTTKDREDWECSYPGTMSFTMVPKEERTSSLLWCDNFKKNKKKDRN